MLSLFVLVSHYGFNLVLEVLSLPIELLESHSTSLPLESLWIYEFSLWVHGWVHIGKGLLGDIVDVWVLKHMTFSFSSHCSFFLLQITKLWDSFVQENLLSQPVFRYITCLRVLCPDKELLIALSRLLLKSCKVIEGGMTIAFPMSAIVGPIGRFSLGLGRSAIGHIVYLLVCHLLWIINVFFPFIKVTKEFLILFWISSLFFFIVLLDLSDYWEIRWSTLILNCHWEAF